MKKKFLKAFWINDKRLTQITKNLFSKPVATIAGQKNPNTVMNIVHMFMFSIAALVHKNILNIFDHNLIFGYSFAYVRSSLFQNGINA